MINEVIYCIHSLDFRRNSEIGLTFGQRYGTDIIDEPDEKLDKSLDDEYSDWNPDDDNTNTYYSDEKSNYDHNLDTYISGVYSNNPIINHS